MGRRPSLIHQIERALEATFLNPTVTVAGTHRGRERLASTFPDIVTPDASVSRDQMKIVGQAEDYTFSYGSLRTYRQACCTFFNRLTDDLDIEVRWLRDWTSDMTVLVVDQMRAEDLSDAYIEKTLSALRKLASGARILGWITEPRDVLVPDTLYEDLRRSPPRLAYRTADANAIRDLVVTNRRDGVQFGQILDLMRASGLRRTEWCYLREDDLDRANTRVSVRKTIAKGGRERVIALDAVGAVGLYQALAAIPQGANWLFPETRQLAKRLEVAIRLACAELEIRCLGQHGYRALFAEEFLYRRLEAGLTEQEARKELTLLLGHGRTDVTYRYVPRLS